LWLLAQQRVSPHEESWLRVIGNYLRANADTLDDFSAAHFAFHPFTLMGGLPQAMRVFGTEDRLDALLESLNESVFAKPGTDSAPQPYRNDDCPILENVLQPLAGNRSSNGPATSVQHIDSKAAFLQSPPA
jgi:hypothetical protein